jgi:hypothetical protein
MLFAELVSPVPAVELTRVWPSPTGYPLIDATSSGLTHSWGSPLLSFLVKHVIMIDSRRVEPVASNIFTGQNFGEIDVRWGDGNNDSSSDSGTAVTVRILGQDGNVHIAHTVPLFHLSSHYIGDQLQHQQVSS